MNRTVAIIAALAASMTQAKAQDLVLNGHIIGSGAKDRSVSVINLYTYEGDLQESVLQRHTSVRGDAHFRFVLALNKGYILEVISNNGSHKRVVVNTDLLPDQPMDRSTCEVNIDIAEGVKWGRDPEDVAWVSYDPTTSCFGLSDAYRWAAQAD